MEGKRSASFSEHLINNIVKKINSSAFLSSKGWESHPFLEFCVRLRAPIRFSGLSINFLDKG
jgi:hypothetical protein